MTVACSMLQTSRHIPYHSVYSLFRYSFRDSFSSPTRRPTLCRDFVEHACMFPSFPLSDAPVAHARPEVRTGTLSAYLLSTLLWHPSKHCSIRKASPCRQKLPTLVPLRLQKLSRHPSSGPCCVGVTTRTATVCSGQA